MPRELPSTRCENPAAVDAICNRIEELPVVNGRVRFDTKHNRGAGRINVNVWCRGTHEKFKDRQPYIDLNSTAVPNWDVAAQKLLTLIESTHAGCVEAAQAARLAAAAQSSGGGSSTGTRPAEPDISALQAMMRLEAARARAAAANMAALAAQKEHEAAEAEVEELKRVLDPKRPRTHTIEEDGPTLELDGMGLLRPSVQLLVLSVLAGAWPRAGHGLGRQEAQRTGLLARSPHRLGGIQCDEHGACRHRQP